MLDNIAVNYSINNIINSNGLNLLYLNINSLLNKLEDIELILANYKLHGILIHFLALTEVRLDDLTCEYYNLDQYKSYYCNKEKNSGGVALFCHNSISTSVLTQLTLMNVELLCISVASPNIKICVFYKQPTVLTSTFLSIIDSFMDDYRNCIMIGDANIDLLKNSTNANRLFSLTLSNSYFILNKIEPDLATRVAHRDGNISTTIIDHIYSDLVHYKYNLTLTDSPISDHRMLLLNFANSLTNQHHNNTLDHRSVEKTDFNKFRNMLINSPYFTSQNMDANSVENCLEFIKSTLQNSTTTKIIPIRNSSKPWITEELLQHIAERDKYFRLSKKSPTNTFISNKYKQLKYRAEKLRINLRNSYFSNLISRNLTNTRKLWATFNHIIHNKNKTLDTIDTITDSQGQPISDDKLKANELNNYFSTVGANLAEQLTTNNQFRPRMCTLRGSINNSIVLTSYSQEDIRNTILSLNNTNSSEDGISSRILKSNIDIFAPILTDLINSSFSDGCFPDSLKLAKIIPIFKSGNRATPKNYRPISILSTVSKVFEKLLCNALESFFVKHKVIHTNQFGFQKGSGTLSAAAQLVSKIQDALDSKMLATGIFIDLQKAFDTISHKDILEKLYRYGIRGKAHSILESYLLNRNQYVALGKTTSDTNNCTFGIPQGSNLGPLIFLIYINDLFDVPMKGYIQLFADDAVILHSGSNLSSVFTDIQPDLDALYEWLYNNLLSINTDKTKFIVFHSSHYQVNPTNLTLTINDKPIERVFDVKYLGLHLHHNLKWNLHIDNIIKKTTPLIGALRRLNKPTPQHLLLSIYFAHIHSRLSYLSPIWGSATPSYKLQDLQVLQNRAIRNIFFNDYYRDKMSTTEILNKYKILNITRLIEYNTTILFHNILNNKIKINHTTTRNNDIHQHFTRTRSNIHVTKSNNNYGLFSVFNHGARLYNALQPSMKSITSASLFKNKLKLHVLAQSSNQ